MPQHGSRTKKPTPIFSFDAESRSKLVQTIGATNKETLQKALKLVNAGAVSKLLPGLKGIEAEIIDKRTYRASWVFYSGNWQSFCTCYAFSGCGHTLAAAVLAVSGQWGPFGSKSKLPKDYDPKREEYDREVAELISSLGRPVSESEAAFFPQLRKLHTRLRYRYSSDSITWPDLTGLGLVQDPPQVSSGQLMQGWWIDPPKTLLHLLNYLVLGVEKSGNRVPDWLAPLFVGSPIRAEIEASLRADEIKLWKERLSARFSVESEVSPPSPVLRLRYIYPKFEWQWAPKLDASFSKIGVGELRGLLRMPKQQLFSLDLASRSLLMAAQSLGMPTSQNSLNINIQLDNLILHRLFLLPEVAERLVGPDGVPIVRAEEQLVWEFQKTNGTAGENLTGRLVRESGDPILGDIKLLSGTPPLYLVENTVYRGPRPFMTASRTDNSVSLPVEVMKENPEWVLQLQNEQVRLPAELIPKSRIVKLMPCARFVLDPMVEHHSYAMLSLCATADNGKLRWVFAGDGWRESAGLTGNRDRQGNFIRLDDSLANSVIGLLRESGFVWFVTRGFWSFRLSQQTIPAFLVVIDKLQNLGVSVEYSSSLAPFFEKPAEVSARIIVEEAQNQIDWFDVSMEWSCSDLDLTEDEIKLLMAAQGRFVELKGKGWRRIHSRPDEKLDAVLADLGYDPLHPSGFENQRYHALQLTSENVKGTVDSQTFLKVLERANKESYQEVTAPANGFTGSLRSYQLDGLNFLNYLSHFNLGGVLADDMGLGKTVQTIAWIVSLAERYKEELSVLIVCPKSVLRNWESEIHRFSPKLTVQVLAGVQPAGPYNGGITITNYAQLRAREESLVKHHWTAVVLDEAQSVKNPQSTVSQLVRRLHSRHRVALTGTPIENRPLDLWSIFAFAQPGLLGSMASFKRLYDSKNQDNQALSLSRLQKRVRHFMLRRTKGQVTPDLPERIEEELCVDLEGEQKSLYQAELKNARSLITGIGNKQDLDRARFNVLQSLMRLRQICCDPRLRLKNRSARVPSAKLEAMLDQVQPILEEGHKIIIFSQFVEMLKLIEIEIKRLKVGYAVLTGQSENREELVETFQSDPSCQVFLLSLKAGGVGLNLTAASYVILYDPWWNPAVEAQAIDRTHRIGQKKTVIAYRLIARGTVEEKIRLLQRQKSKMAEAVVQEESLATVLDMESLQFLLSEDSVTSE